MMGRPMSCPNPVHNDETDFMAGMDIIPDEDVATRDGTGWYCCDCKSSFVYDEKDGTPKSTLVVKKAKRKAKR